jgi:hypothetical protein
VLRSLLIGLVLSILAGACSDTTGPARVPQPPERVFLSPGVKAILITWIDASGNEDIFLVEVSIDGGPFSILTNAPRNTTTAQLLEPEALHVYRFRVSACNRAGCSDVREVSVDTKDWLKPTINSVTAVPTGIANLVVTVNVASHGHPLDVSVVLSKVGDPNFRIERAETITPPTSPGAADQLIKQYFFAGLLQGDTVFYQVTSSNAFGTTVSSAKPFVVDYSPPQLLGVSITAIASTRADFALTVRPGGLQTLVFASIVPVDSAHVTSTIPRASTNGAPDGSVKILNVAGVLLAPNTMYKARFVVTNDAGSVASSELRFTTLP